MSAEHHCFALGPLHFLPLPRALSGDQEHDLLFHHLDTAVAHEDGIGIAGFRQARFGVLVDSAVVNNRWILMVVSNLSLPSRFSKDSVGRSCAFVGDVGFGSAESRLRSMRSAGSQGSRRALTAPRDSETAEIRFICDGWPRWKIARSMNDSRVGHK